MLVERGACPEGEVFKEGRCVHVVLAEVDTIHRCTFSVSSNQCCIYVERIGGL